MKFVFCLSGVKFKASPSANVSPSDLSQWNSDADMRVIRIGRLTAGSDRSKKYTLKCLDRLDLPKRADNQPPVSPASSQMSKRRRINTKSPPTPEYQMPKASAAKAKAKASQRQPAVQKTQALKAKPAVSKGTLMSFLKPRQG